MHRRGSAGYKLRAALIRNNACCFSDRYDMVSNSFLAEGSFGSVHRCTDSLTSAPRAVKKIVIPPNERQQSQLIEEVNALVVLDHPHIVRLIEYFREDGKLLLVMEILEGPTLGQSIHSHGRFDDTFAARCTRHMLKAIYCCHCQNITHNDVCEENFQFEAAPSSSILKMVDFGLSHGTQTQETEVFFERKREIWAAGTILFKMLTGNDLLPKEEGTSGYPHQQLSSLTDASYVPSRLQSVTLSPDSYDLLQGMLNHSTSERLAAREALRHPFITSLFIETDNKLLQEKHGPFSLDRCLDALRLFHDATRLMRLALLVVAHLLTNNNRLVDSIRWLFRCLVRDGQRVDENMMRERMREFDTEIPNDFRSIFRSADQAGKESLSYVEFMAASIILEPKIYRNNHMLAAVFRFLCADSAESISGETLQLVFHSTSCALGDVVLEACGNQTMNYEAFVDMMSPDDWEEGSTDAEDDGDDWADPYCSERGSAASGEENCSLPERVTSYNPVKSAPSIAFAICQLPGFYSKILKPFYEAQRVSNVVLGVVSGSSTYARSCAKMGYAKIVELGSGQGAFFLMLNPKYHDNLLALDLSTDPKMRLVCWWIHPEFLPELHSWFSIVNDTVTDQNEDSLGGPGDFGFSDRAKPSGYLNTYRDLAGPEHLQMLETLKNGLSLFLGTIFGDALRDKRLSLGFHYPVRTQYSTLHLQVRVNAGEVAGGPENRAIDFFKLQSLLKSDLCALSADAATLHFQASANLRATILGAAKAKKSVVEEVGPESLVLHSV